MPSFSSRINAYLERRRQLREQRRAAAAARRATGLDKRLVMSLSGRRLPTPKQMKYLPQFLSNKEKTTLKLLVAGIALALSALGIRYVAAHSAFVPTVGGDYVETTVGQPRFVNPLLASGNDVDNDLVRLVFNGLVKTDAKGQIVPDLADHVAVSADGKTYEFSLKKDLVWHDGQPVTSRDVVTTIEMAKNPAVKSPLFSQFKNVAVEQVGDLGVKFTLAEPFAPFLSLLTVGIVPEHLWSDVGPKNVARADLNIKPVGTGPFKFKAFTKDKQGAVKTYTLARNDRYFAGAPYFSTFTFRFAEDFGAATDLLVRKKVDGSSFLPLEFRGDVEEKRSARIYTLRLPQYASLFFNQKKSPVLKSLAVRQALAFAIDRDRILREALHDDAAQAYGPILPGFVGFHPDVKKYRYDIQSAAALLDKEGWKLDADNVRKKDVKDAKGNVEKTPLAVTVTTVDAEENIAVASIIKENWEALGVAAELSIVPASKIEKDVIRPREYETLLYGEIVGADPDPFPFWHSSQNEGNGLNLALYTNRRADELLEKARLTTSEEERGALYREFQDILAEEVPAVFLYSPTYTYAVARHVRGVEEATIFSPADRFVNVNTWYVRTKWIWK